MVRISNQAILGFLEENSRTPFVKIAKKLGVSETAIRKRIKKMQKKGIIRRFTVEVNPKKLGYKVMAIIGFDAEPEHLLSIMEKVKKFKEAKIVYSASGDHMVLMECWFFDSSELQKFNKKLKSIEGITKICPAIIIERIK